MTHPDRPLERFLDRCIGWVMTHPKRLLALIVLVVGALASQLPDIEIDTDLENFVDASTLCSRACR